MGRPTNMRGRVCVITGASSGIGKATALGFAKAGSQVVMVCRNQTSGELAKAEIRKISGNPGVDLFLADLSDLSAVRTLSAEINARHPVLSVLINNAAVYKSKRTLTVNGHETMFATNHLAPFLLTNSLLAGLQASGQARVLNIAAPSTERLHFDNLQGERRFRPLAAFGATKMANLLFTFDLARRLAGIGVLVNAVHPGLVRSRLMREAPWYLRWLVYVMSAPPGRAAASIVQVATAAQFSGQSGRFYHDGKEIGADSYAYDPDVQRQLWEVSVALTKTVMAPAVERR